MVAKIRDGSDLRNNYENVVALSTLGIFSKIGSAYIRSYGCFNVARLIISGIYSPDVHVFLKIFWWFANFLQIFTEK